MKLSEIFSQLSYGEFSQLSLGNGGNGSIDPDKHGAVLSHVNLGLTALHSRFLLKEGRLVVALQPGRDTYPLTGAFAVTNRRSRESVRFLLDTQDAPFEDDIHKVESVHTEHGVELSLNDRTNPYACATPSAQNLRVPLAIVNDIPGLPEAFKATQLKLSYRANHPLLTMGFGTFDPAREEVALPHSHLEPLLYYVASRVHNPIGMSNEFHAGNSYYAKYEAACARLENEGLEVDQGSQNTRAHRNGWV